MVGCGFPSFEEAVIRPLHSLSDSVPAEDYIAIDPFQKQSAKKTPTVP